MLFNSFEFIFIFLPVVSVVFYVLEKHGYHIITIAWLVIASLFFYGWWSPVYLWLILFSIAFNFAVGSTLRNGQQRDACLFFLILGVSGNLMLLGYFKYANFFVDTINAVSGSTYHMKAVVIPLAISFFTFQQITYLVDTYKGKTAEHNFINYCLFVTFFPQLIAGPIVHHREMLPQFTKNIISKFNHQNVSIGVTIFILGLFKKVILADGIAIYATPVFEAALQGVKISFFEAWIGALSYTFQLYFDFSGYSDMAIGIARIYGIRLPLNFYSPYQAVNIIEFWQRWHITLSRFFRDYLYIPLGGNRKGKFRRNINVMITMILGGLWHGAGWTFIIWGALHGCYLMINHVWQSILHFYGYIPNNSTWWGRGMARIITFVAVVIAWVFFRAETLPGALNVLQGMSGLNGVVLHERYHAQLNQIAGLGDYLSSLGVHYISSTILQGSGEISYLLLLLLLLFTWFAPNTYQIMLRYEPALGMFVHKSNKRGFKWLQWKPSFVWAGLIAFFGLFSIARLHHVSEFLYFNF